MGDPRGELFGRGLQAVIALTGKAEPQARTMIGRWLKTMDDEALLILRTIDEAVEHRPADPTAWIEAALRKRKTGPPTDQKTRMQQWL